MKEIPLTQGQIALVDDRAYEMLSKFKWCANKFRNSYYSVRNSQRVDGKQMTILMHRVIMNPSDDMEIDHINGNGLDNRRCNLRVVTPRQNSQNRQHTKSSKYPGVSFRHGRGKKWVTSIWVHGIRKHLGYFDTEEAAARTYMAYSNVIEMSKVLKFKECA